MHMNASETPIGLDDSSNDLVADAGEHAPSTAAGEAEQVVDRQAVSPMTLKLNRKYGIEWCPHQ